MEKDCLLGSFELSMIFQDLGNMDFVAVLFKLHEICKLYALYMSYVDYMSYVSYLSYIT